MTVKYIVCLHGQPIGGTDLAFARGHPLSRMGWFHPDANGERWIAGDPWKDVVGSWVHGFTLRREDGTSIPTESVGICDTERLLAFAREAELEEEWRGWQPRDEELERMIEEDLALLDAQADGDWEEDILPVAWVPDSEADANWPRYQIHVALFEPDIIP